MLHEETTSTLLCGDLGTMMGDGPATIEDDIVPRALETEDVFLASSMTPALAPTIRKLADLQPSTLGIMHGPSYSGDGGGMLRGLADAYEKRLSDAEQ